MRILRASFVAVIALVLAGCVEGFQKETWSKAELMEWYLKYAPKNPRIQKFGYAGSDAKYHYFITRPIDSFFSPRVSRSEIMISDERPRSALGRRLMFYYVDPGHDFQKVPNTEVPE